MSGGFFDYQDFQFKDIADTLRMKIAQARQNPDCASCEATYSESFINEMSETYDQLVRLVVKLHRINYVLSGDDGEADYTSRLAIDLSKIEFDDPCEDDKWIELMQE